MRKLGLVLSFSKRTIQILLTHFAGQDWHSSNLVLRTCIDSIVLNFFWILFRTIQGLFDYEPARLLWHLTSPVAQSDNKFTILQQISTNLDLYTC